MTLSNAAQKTRIYDANAIWSGIKIIDMMEKAGSGIAAALLEEYGSDKSYAIICGLGNNGGDGLAAGKYFAGKTKKKVIVYLIGRENDIKTKESLENFKQLKKIAKKFDNIDFRQDCFAKDIEPADIIVECLLGTGIKGRLNKRFKDVIKRISKMKSKRVGIDVPTPGYKVSFVISLHFEKVKGAKVVDIGIPADVDQVVGPGEVRELAIPLDKSYKSQNGELFIFG